MAQLLVIDSKMAARIQSFHELSGVTISEKTKAFQIYLKDLKTETKNDQSKLDFILNSITPRTHLETLFKVQMLLHFHQFQQLIEVIKSENKTLIRKVMKDKWFFNEIVKKFTPEELVNDFFKHTSYVTRVKVLNKLSKCPMSDEYANRLFEAYSKKYGIHSAKQLLPLFSSDKIKEILSSNELKLNTSMLQQLINKDPNLAVIFWDKYKETITPFLAKRDVLLLWKLIENQNQCPIKFGRQTTNKLIQNHQKRIIENADKWIEWLKLREVIKRLGDNYRELFCNWFAHRFIEVHSPHYNNNDLRKYLKHLDKQRQATLYTDAYTKLFNKAPYEEVEKITDPSALYFIIDVNKRDAIAEKKYNDNKQETKWIPFMTVEKSIPILKEKIALYSDFRMRSNLLNLLVQTCEINNDLPALLEVEKYFLKRHRNEIPIVQQSFLCTLCDNFKIEHLSCEHWKYLLELVRLFELNKEQLKKRRTILQKHLFHCWSNNLPIKQHLVDFLKEYGSSSIEYCLNGSPEFKRTTLELINDILSKVFSGEKLAEAYVLLFKVTKEFNHHSSKEQRVSLVNLDQRLVECMQTLLDNDTNLADIFWYFIYNKESIFRAYMLSLFWKQKKFENRNIHTILWLLQHESGHILENFDVYSAPEIYKYFITNRNILYVTKMYDQMSEKLVEKTLAVFRGDSHVCSQRAEAIKVLSFLLDEFSYCELISKFYPMESRLDVDLDKSSTVYSIQKAICDSLKNLCISSVVIPSVLHFCTGDYLKISLSPLYSISCHTPEVKLYEVIGKLLNKPLSVRKHALYLSSAVLDASFVFKTLETFTTKNENYSMQCHLIKIAFKYFCRNPDDHLWNLVQNFIVNVNDLGEEPFKMLTGADRIPKEYSARYIEFIWKLLEGKEPAIEVLKYNLVGGAAEDTIRSLSNKFCEKVISENLEKNKWEVRSFTLKYLYCADNSKTTDSKLEVIFNALQKVRTDNFETNKGKYLRIINQFTEDFVYFAAKLENTQLPLAFKTLWEDLVDIEEDFRAYTMLNMLILHLTTPTENYVQLFCQKFAEFLHEFENRFGVITVMYLEAEFTMVTRKLFKERGKEFESILPEIFENVLLSHSSISSALFVIKYIISHQWVLRQFKVDVSRMIDILKTRSEPIIKIHVNEYLRISSV